MDESNLPPWHRQAIEALDFPLGWMEPCADPAAWKREGRAAFESLLIEGPAPTDPEPRWIAAERRDGYELRLVELALSRRCRVRAYLAVPDGEGPFPAAVMLHDHGAFFAIGKEKVFRPFAGDPKAEISADWMARNYGGRSPGDELCRRGWVVFASDALGWGDRECNGYESQQALASNLFNLGSSWAGLVAVEDRAAAAFVASLPFVDSSRVAAVGHSFGAYRSWQLAALSDDVTLCAASCSFGTVAGLMAPGGNRTRGQSAFCMTHPGLSRLMDFPDVAALAAPKPLFLINGLDDPLFPADCVRAAFAKTAAAYRGFGAADAFRAELRPGGHVFSIADQNAVFDWLDGARPARG
jgi:dienelactone hydrolase